MTGPYQPQEALSTLPDGAQTGLGRLLQGVFVIEVGWVLGAALWLGLWAPLVQPDAPDRLSSIVTLSTHGILLIVTLMVARAAQKRGFWALIGPWERAFEDFASTLMWTGGLALIAAVFSALAALQGEARVQPVLPWLLFLPVAAATIFLQTMAEEIYFRGYLQSSLAAQFARPVIWMVGPSFFFGLLHWQTGVPVTDAIQTVIITTVFGLAAADLTARTGTLGAAIALHFSYNALLLLVASVTGEAFAGLALFLLPSEASAGGGDAVLTLELLAWLMTLGIFWLAARNAVRR